MTLWEQNNSSLVKQKELNRLLRMAQDEYGIRDKAIAVPFSKIEEFLNQAYYEVKEITSSDIAKFIYKAKPNWSNKGIVLLIETTEPKEENKKNYSLSNAADFREFFIEICMFRFLVYNASLFEKAIVSYRMSEIITKLSTFDQSRFYLAEELANTPCLFVREVDLKDKIRDTNDCISLLDSAFFNRVRFNKPTIISLTTPAEKFPTPEKFGKFFSSVIQMTDKNSVFKVRLK